MNNKHAVNDQIRSREVRLIAESGEQIGVMSTNEARSRAHALGLDLVAINGNDVIPVCKILDYGKFKYEQSRKDRENAKKMRESRVDLKEIQLRPNIDDNDLKTKAKRAQTFLDDGDKVKVIMKFRGRENAHVDVGRSVMTKFFDLLDGFKYERPIGPGDRQLFAVLASGPKKAASSE